MSDKKNLLIIFVRNPELGKVKKRLARELGDAVALEIYQKLLSHTCVITQGLDCDKTVYYSDFIERNDLWKDHIFHKKLQKGEDLGQRMERAFMEGFSAGYSRIVLIGSDLRDLGKEDLERAFVELEDNDQVIGPASDGGYYLIGKKQLHPELFKNKAWGGDTVLRDTLNDLKHHQIILLEEKNDIDIKGDLQGIPEFQQYLDSI